MFTLNLTDLSIALLESNPFLADIASAVNPIDLSAGQVTFASNLLARLQK